MRTIEATAIVTRDRKLRMPVPRDILPGEHRVVVVIDEQVSKAPQGAPALNLPLHDLGPWPSELSLRREDLYGDEGR